MATIYLERDNTITLALTQDGSAPTANVITKAAIWFPGSAFSDDAPRVFDTDGAFVELTDNATKVALNLGAAPITSGQFFCYLTIYDSANPNGIAWDSFMLVARDWPATAS